MNPEFDQALHEELVSLVKGPVFRPSDDGFRLALWTFNGQAKCLSKIVVAPLDAQDVSAVIRFCLEHGLSPSVRSGGYGVAGWAVAGDITIDMSLMKSINIEAPSPGEMTSGITWTRLKDVPATPHSPPGSAMMYPRPARTSKRPREEESPGGLPDPDPFNGDPWTTYDTASQATGAFLRGPPLPREAGETPREPPRHRQRLQSPQRRVDTSPQAPLLENRSSLAQSPNRTLAAFHPNLGGQPPSSRTTSVQVGLLDHISGTALSARIPLYGGVDPPEISTALPSSLGHLPGVSSNPIASTSTDILSGRLPESLTSMDMERLGSTKKASAQPIHSHAYVTFGAGARQKEVDAFTAEHPLEGVNVLTGRREDGIVPYHVPSSAHPVGSSTMLLAGFGFISRMYGLSIDNLVEVEMVLADGRIVIVNREEDPDLWWAIRGAGPAFGIATRYKVKAFPVPVVFSGNLIYRFHRSTASSLIKHFRDCVKGAPRELYANVHLTAGPADQDSLVVIQMCFKGPRERGMKYWQAISSWKGEQCLLSEVNEKSYLSQQDSVAQILRGKSGREWFIRSSLIYLLPDEVVDQTVLSFATTPIGCTWLIELAGGAIADYEDTCLPKEMREAVWTVAAFHQWDMGVDDPRCIAMAEDWMRDVLLPVSPGGPLPVFLGRHEPPERTMACFGKNWTRLADLKRKYDPEGFFKHNFWPLDKNGKPLEETHKE